LLRAVDFGLPVNAPFSILIDLPKRNASARNAQYLAHPFRARIKVLVAKQAPHKDCCFADVHGKMD
jgi:hypothetical protein